MKYFYEFMLWMLEFDLAIARSTGRDPRHINQLILERQEYELLLWRELI